MKEGPLVTGNLEPKYYVGIPAKGEAAVGAAISDPHLPATSDSDVKAATASVARLKDRRIGFRVAKLGTLVVGFAGIGPVRNGDNISMTHGSTALLSRLVVNEAHRSQGLGVQLIQSAEEAAKALGYGMMVSAMTDAGAATARKAEWTVLDKTARLTWIEPERAEEKRELPKGSSISGLSKVAGLRQFSAKAAGEYPNVAYKVFNPADVLKFAVSYSDGPTAYKWDPLAEAALDGTMDLSNLPFTGFFRFLPDIFRHGGKDRTRELCSDWVGLNPEEAQEAASRRGVQIESFARRLVNDMELSASR